MVLANVMLMRVGRFVVMTEVVEAMVGTVVEMNWVPNWCCVMMVEAEVVVMRVEVGVGVNHGLPNWSCEMMMVASVVAGGDSPPPSGALLS